MPKLRSETMGQIRECAFAQTKMLFVLCECQSSCYSAWVGFGSMPIHKHNKCHILRFVSVCEWRTDWMQYA